MSIKDFFGIEINEGDYVYIPHNNVGRVKLVTEKEIKITTSYSDYNYYISIINSHMNEGKQIDVLNINDRVHSIKNINEIISQIDNNEQQIEDRTLESQQKADAEKSRRADLKKTMKPGDAFKMSGYGSYVLYLGVVDKKHIYCNFGKNYSYNRDPADPEYCFDTGNKFKQAMKSKKAVDKKFDGEIDVPAMFTKLEQEIRSASTERSRYSWRCSVTTEQLNEVKEIYNNLGL
jgi:hypothetical protein